MSKIILFNGPPGCGKDLAGSFFRGIDGVLITKFARILKEMTHRAFNTHNQKHDAFERVKDQPEMEFYGLTPREVYIAFSEKFIKPLFGKRFFGASVALQIDELNPRYTVVTDCGFRIEPLVLSERFGAENIILIQIKRRGKTFEGDSRKHFKLTVAKNVMVENNGTIEEFKEAISGVLRSTKGFQAIGEEITETKREKPSKTACKIREASI